MNEITPASASGPSPFAGSDWFDPLEEAVRSQVRSFIEQLLEEELEAALGRGRYERGASSNGRRHGHRPRQLVTTFGPLTLSVPRARLHDEVGEQEWKSALLPAYKRLSRRAEALIAEAYLAGMNTRRVRRALAKLFEGHIGKDMVSRAWQRTRAAWEAWQRRDLAGDDIVRLILDGTVVKVRLDRKAAAISLLIALGIRRDGQKVVLAIKNLGGETEAAWRVVLDDLISRGMAKPELVVVDGGKGLEAALASLWDDVPAQRCTVHKERNLLAHAPKHLHEEVRADFNDMMHARTAAEVVARRKAFLAKWKLRCRPVATSLEEAGERLFTFVRYPPEQWRSLRTTNAIERLHEEFKRRIKTQCLLPCAETAAMLLWALLASGQITMRRVDGWPSLDRSPTNLDLAA
ncbi:MAG TPA: IS256 family transposase [Planctomycetota bacterium]|nr:IS256 family transposase [Planctomycetota bacterium]